MDEIWTMIVVPEPTEDVDSGVCPTSCPLRCH